MACRDVIVLLLAFSCKKVKSGWVDPDTSSKFSSTVALAPGDDREYQLVFSDEFEREGRSFADGEDSRWTAMDKNDYTNDALHFYRSDNVKTKHGKLKISTTFKDNNYRAFNEKTKKYFADTKHVQSAMLQGWNKFCMTGGIVEFSAKLPGKGSIGGLWPALWLLGNLARATYVGSSDWMWPFSYDTCDMARVDQQEINACRKVGHYGMSPGIGRGAPEIDILEAMGGEPGPLPNTPIERPYFSSSLQVAPGLSKNRPLMMHQPKPGHWYEGLEYGNASTTSLNPFFYGVTLIHKPKAYTYQSDAISANTHINESFFEKQNKYRVEWEPNSPGMSDGYVKWFVNDQFIYGINGDSLNITGTQIPNEPMYLIMNTAVASSWGFPVPCPEGCDCECFECGNPDCDCALPTGYCDNFPASFDIDYVRVWQAIDEPKHRIGCSTKERPTDLFIQGHKERYMEEDDKQMLKQIRFGGGNCAGDYDCGGGMNGYCTDIGVCECDEGYAGSFCHSSYGFDDKSYSELDNSLKVSWLMLPPMLLLYFVVLVTIFCVACVVFTVVQRRERQEVQDIGEITPLMNYDPRLQRNKHAFGDERPVSYCLIDGRMIDN
mmetsp:Transcript_2366/g.3531  ORF Transcript_2366/g.3531 Transcript_2366/m.3531 type:complete len:605 (-) Transcript_2366:109-1923(-)